MIGRGGLRVIGQHGFVLSCIRLVDLLNILFLSCFTANRAEGTISNKIVLIFQFYFLGL